MAITSSRPLMHIKQSRTINSTQVLLIVHIYLADINCTQLCAFTNFLVVAIYAGSAWYLGRNVLNIDIVKIVNHIPKCQYHPFLVNCMATMLSIVSVVRGITFIKTFGTLQLIQNLQLSWSMIIEQSYAIGNQYCRPCGKRYLLFVICSYVIQDP